MKALSKVLLMVLLISLFTMVIHALETLWKEQITRSVTLLQQGRYSEAAKVADKALKVAEKTFGINHPEVAVSRNIMAAVYQAQGKYAEAETLYKRVLAIDEKALAKDLPPNQFSPRDLSLPYQTGHPGKGD
jgi:tetratricopeptide (TPR) repeat protein